MVSAQPRSLLLSDVSATLILLSLIILVSSPRISCVAPSALGVGHARRGANWTFAGTVDQAAYSLAERNWDGEADDRLWFRHGPGCCRAIIFSVRAVRSTPALEIPELWKFQQERIVDPMRALRQH